MTKRKLLTATAIVVLVTGLMAGAISTALAISTGPGQNFFELDASSDLSNGAAPKAAITDSATTAAPDDWDRIAADHGLANNGATASHANASSFDAETTATGSANNATIFTGGGSKDQQPISQWGWKDASGGLPDKDNLLHAMSARYGAGATAHIYFGADRFDNSGDSQIGFWFFNSQVGTAANGSFSGTHKAGVVPHDSSNPGDILVLSDFTNGGAQPTIRVFEYVGSGGSDGSLNLLGGNATDVRDCKVVSTDDFCAAVNNLDGAVAPWLYTNKSGQHTFGHGEFYEGGLNLTSLGLQNECFSSFLAETRSSQSVTATLKDFVSGPFQNCSTSVVTTPSEGQNGTTALGTDGTITVHDSALVAVNGTSTFSGTLAFAICGPIATGNCSTGGTAVAAKTGVNPITANGSYDSADKVLTTAGRYCWRATVVVNTPAGIPGASDPSDTTSTTECFTLTPARPTLSTTASASVEVGNAIDDTAHLGGTSLDPDGSKADGTITFKLYGPNDATCTTVIEQSVVTLTDGGDGDYKASDGVLSGTLGSLIPTSAGTYRWIASYSGDLPNTLDKAGACGDANESVVVTPGQPAISTVATSADGSSLGTAIDDTAHLTGTKNQPDGSAAGGTITFTLYGPNDATCATAIATRVVNVSGDGFYTASVGTGSGSLTPTAAGTYRWIAAYSGNLPNTKSVTGHCNDANEASVINPSQPAITTQASAATGAALGSAIDDTAHLTGTAKKPNGTAAGGTITFTLYGPNDGTCATVIETSVVTVSGDGFYLASTGTLSGTLGSLTPTDAGTYRWIAAYSGDAPNTLSVSGACNDANEASILISLQPTLDTAQSFVPNDSAIVNVGSGGGNLAGSIRFRLYDNATCSPIGTTLYDKTFTIGTDGVLDVSGLKWTVATDNATAYSTSKSFSWLVQFTSTNGAIKNVTSTCHNENSSITIDNGTQANQP